MSVGGENDDLGGGDIRHLLAAVSRVLYRRLLLSGAEQLGTNTGGVFGHLLAGDEQLDVQSDHLLLDESTVSD